MAAYIATGKIGIEMPPLAVVKPVMLIDRDLFNYDSVWAAAGHPHAVFNLTAAQLQEMTGGAVSDVRQDAAPTAA